MKTFQRWHFIGQHQNETILRVIHRHWFDILMQFGVIMLGLLLLAGSLFFIMFLYPETSQSIHPRFLFFAQNTFFLFLWFYAFLIWIDYYCDVWILTDQRIINIEQKGLFVREMSELQMPKVQDVTTEVKGIIPTMLNYGDVFVQTAGEEERFVFRKVPDPYRVKDEIMRLVRAHQWEDVADITQVLREKM